MPAGGEDDVLDGPWVWNRGTRTRANRRAAAWWNLRELLDPSFGATIALPRDDSLTGDLTTPTWRISSGAKITIESKDDLRKRIGRSTDHGDAVVMAFAPPEEDEYEGIIVYDAPEVISEW